MKCENATERRNISDTRIHCIIYFINPNQKEFLIYNFDFLIRLKHSDLEIMKNLGKKANLIPIIAKCEYFTTDELHNLQLKV